MNACVLIADDDPYNAKALAALLAREPYRLEFASDGPQAVEKALRLLPDAILLDVMMPGLDGFEVCRKLRLDPRLSEVPILMVTALDDRESRLRGLEAGADDFLSKPVDSLELRARLRTTVRLNRFRLLHEERARYQQLFELSPVGVALVGHDGGIVLANPTFMALLGVGNLDQLQAHPMLARVAPAHQAECLGCLMAVLGGGLARQRIETAFLGSDGREIPAEVTVGAVPFAGGTAALVIARDMRERFEAESRLRLAYGELNEAYEKTLEGWVRALDLRDQETQGHTERVTGLTLELAETLGLEDSAQHLRRGALLHDVGKIGVPDAILLKPGALTEEEWRVMRQHPIYAYQWLSSVPFLTPALEIPYAHHERWDGAGYPRGLRGEEIPLSARLFAVVDVYDALTSDRPYRRAWTPDQALNYLERHSGSQFDPHVTQVFLRLMQSRLGADGAAPTA